MNLRIGSRGSKLAVTQAEWVGKQLTLKNPGLVVSYQRIVTTGDRQSEGLAPGVLTKGVFVKEIEDALLRDEIDLAVHSLKDVPQDLPFGLMLGPTPRREDPRDVLISRFGEFLHELPRQSTIGTGSPRRQAQIFHKYKKRSYHFDPIRGNVDTRIKKLQDGKVDALILAYAGLKRLGLEREVTQILEFDDMLPAACQGCLGLELRSDDPATLGILQTIKDSRSDIEAQAERAFLQGLGGNCNIPLGVATTLEGARLKMKAVLLTMKGEKAVEATQDGAHDQPAYVGAQLAERILFNGGSEIMFEVDAKSK